MSVYRVTELIGTSTQSWEDAASVAVQAASGTLRASGSPRLSHRTFKSARTVLSPSERSFRSLSSTRAASRALTPVRGSAVGSHDGIDEPLRRFIASSAFAGVGTPVTRKRSVSGTSAKAYGSSGATDRAAVQSLVDASDPHVARQTAVAPSVTSTTWPCRCRRHTGAAGSARRRQFLPSSRYR